MKLPAEMMKLAQHIIRTKSVEFDPSDAGGSLSRGPGPHLAKETGEAPRASACGRALARERYKPDGCVKAQHPGGKPFTAAAATRGRCKRRIPEGPQGPTPQRLSRSVNLGFFGAKLAIRHAARIVARPALA